MTGRDDIDMIAAEYVLGTLDASERGAVSERRLREPDLAAAISAWERRLAPLDAGTEPVQPPAVLLARIEHSIDQAGTNYRPGHASTEAQFGAEPVKSAIVLQLERRVARWRRAAIAASALAASLVLAVGLREVVEPRGAQNFVAVFQKDDAQPAFLMSVNLATRELTIRPVTADRQVGKAYQLWILAEPLGPVPQSLGLLEDALLPTRKTLSSFEPALLQNATFGISVEPPGGSPTGRPSGPALHGKLLPATP